MVASMCRKIAYNFKIEINGVILSCLIIFAVILSTPLLGTSSAPVEPGDIILDDFDGDGHEDIRIKNEELSIFMENNTAKIIMEDPLLHKMSRFIDIHESTLWNNGNDTFLYEGFPSPNLESVQKYRNLWDSMRMYYTDTALIASSSHIGGIYSYSNSTTNSSMLPKKVKALAMNFRSVLLDDIDGDGDKDIKLIDLTNMSIIYYINKGDGTITLAEVFNLKNVLNYFILVQVNYELRAPNKPFPNYIYL
ncbi:MAG: hypothetical protein AB1779_07275 [Candidatus Thermoplasmatota archaeon]